jgi:hypothetical protein
VEPRLKRSFGPEGQDSELKTVHISSPGTKRLLRGNTAQFSTLLVERHVTTLVRAACRMMSLRICAPASISAAASPNISTIRTTEALLKMAADGEADIERLLAEKDSSATSGRH